MKLEVFCNKNNIPSCIEILRNELEVLNMPQICYKDNDKDTVIDLLNVTWLLINNNKNQAIKINKQTENLFSLKSKLNQFEDGKRKIEQLLEKEKSDHDKVKKSLSETLIAKDDLKDKLREKDKVIKKLESCIRAERLFSKQFSRRREEYIEGLQAELLDLTTRYKPKLKATTARTCVTVPKLKSIEETDTKGDSIIVTLKKYIRNLQDKIQKLGEENASLRGSFINVYHKFLKVRCERYKDEEAGYLLKEKLINLPLAHIIRDAEENINFMMKSIETQSEESKTDEVAETS